MSPRGPALQPLPTPVQEERRKAQRGAQRGSGTQPRYLVGPGVVHREGRGAGMRGAASVEERAAG